MREYSLTYCTSRKDYLIVPTKYIFKRDKGKKPVAISAGDRENLVYQYTEGQYLPVELIDTDDDKVALRERNDETIGDKRIRVHKRQSFPAHDCVKENQNIKESHLMEKKEAIEANKIQAQYRTAAEREAETFYDPSCSGTVSRHHDSHERRSASRQSYESSLLSTKSLQTRLPSVDRRQRSHGSRSSATRSRSGESRRSRSGMPTRSQLRQSRRPRSRMPTRSQSRQSRRSRSRMPTRSQSRQSRRSPSRMTRRSGSRQSRRSSMPSVGSRQSRLRTRSRSGENLPIPIRPCSREEFRHSRTRS